MIMKNEDYIWQFNDTWGQREDADKRNEFISGRTTFFCMPTKTILARG